MVVTVKSNKVNVGVFEAMIYGLETEVYADGTFDLVAHDMKKVEAIVDKCGGKIVSIVDRLHNPIS